jgi:hypothetical protein
MFLYVSKSTTHANSEESPDLFLHSYAGVKTCYPYDINYIYRLKHL